MFLQETFVVEDCIDYDTLTSDNNKFQLKSGNANITYNNNGLSVVGSVNNTCLYMYTKTLPTNHIIELDVTSFTIGAYNFSSEICASHIVISNGTSVTRLGKFTDDNYGNNGFTYTDINRVNPPYHLKIVKDNGNITIFIDNVQIHSISAGTVDFGFKSYSNRGVLVKNMKIKPL